jgi:hypothetical protein
MRSRLTTEPLGRRISAALVFGFTAFLQHEGSAEDASIHCDATSDILKAPDIFPFHRSALSSSGLQAHATESLQHLQRALDQLAELRRDFCDLIERRRKAFHRDSLVYTTLVERTFLKNPNDPSAAEWCKPDLLQKYTHYTASSMAHGVLKIDLLKFRSQEIEGILDEVEASLTAIENNDVLGQADLELSQSMIKNVKELWDAAGSLLGKQLPFFQAVFDQLDAVTVSLVEKAEKIQIALRSDSCLITQSPTKVVVDVLEGER